MAIPMPIHLAVHSFIGKAMKFIGQHIVEIALSTGVGAVSITGYLTLNKIEKENTKYEYKDWLLYKQGDFIYAKKGKQLIKIETANFGKLEKMIEANM